MRDIKIKNTKTRSDFKSGQYLKEYDSASDSDSKPGSASNSSKNHDYEDDDGEG